MSGQHPWPGLGKQLCFLHSSLITPSLSQDPAASSPLCLCVELALSEKGQPGPGRVFPRKAMGSSVTPRVMPAHAHCLLHLSSSGVEQGCWAPRTPRFGEKEQGISAETLWNDGHSLNLTHMLHLFHPCAHPARLQVTWGESLLSESGHLRRPQACRQVISCLGSLGLCWTSSLCCPAPLGETVHFLFLFSKPSLSPHARPCAQH